LFFATGGAFLGAAGSAGGGASAAEEGAEGGSNNVKPKINVGQQNKHIPGTNNYAQEIASGKLKKHTLVNS